MGYYKQLGKCLVKGDGFPGMILHYCPACDDLHPYAVDKAFDNGSIWTFNNDEVKPSFHPSMRIRHGRDLAKCCHYFVTDGEIRYCGDCTHEYSGKTIPLPEIPERYLKI